MAVLDELRHPVIAAPMGGGPSTPALVAAVGAAGGLGVLAAGYRTPEAVRADIRAVRERTGAPFGVNVFVPMPEPVDGAALAGYAARVRAEAQRLGMPAGDPVDDDDRYPEKVALLCDDPVPLVSFTFGAPAPEVVRALRAAGTYVLITVTSPEEAVLAARAGADGVLAQGWEAGAHRGGWTDADGSGEYGTLVLTRLVARATDLPVVASGGIADGAGVAAVLAAGAVAAQLGTAFLRCPEAGTSAVHRAALAAGAAPTAVTRAFTGRRARGIVNRFIREYSAGAPSAYPQVHHLTAPLRAAARAVGDPDLVNLWAGQGYPLAGEVPAGQLVERLAGEARAALAMAARRFAIG
jgi:nitronate monooxygenase